MTVCEYSSDLHKYRILTGPVPIQSGTIVSHVQRSPGVIPSARDTRGTSKTLACRVLNSRAVEMVACVPARSTGEFTVFVVVEYEGK